MRGVHIILLLSVVALVLSINAITYPIRLASRFRRPLP